MPRSEKKNWQKMVNIDLIIGNNKKKDLIHILEEHMGEKESAAESIEVIDIAQIRNMNLCMWNN